MVGHEVNGAIPLRHNSALGWPNHRVIWLAYFEVSETVLLKRAHQF